VGDVIEVQSTAGPVSGKVEDLSLRLTTLRASDGTLHVVPNGNIQVASNKVTVMGPRDRGRPGGRR
jgi:moderate conductance mechanosensitive channel